MKIRVVRVCRRPKWPLWAVLLVLAWLGLGGAAVWLGAHFGRDLRLCLFKQLTHLPCPTCGLTRSVLSLLRGEFGQAWLYNPLLCSIIAFFFTVTAVRIISGWTVRLHLSCTERVVACVLAIVLVFANWAYVIFYVG